MLRTTITLLLFLTTALSALIAQDTPLWMRYPAISPDGATIVFSYKGDLYRVPSEGGLAYPLTLHEAYDHSPVWSHDGKSIAFASDRYGNFDVFVMPAEGGTARRLTFHSSGDYPSDFTADDKAILFTSSRLDIASNAQFPSGVLPELYLVPVEGGMPKQALPVPALDTRVSADGKLMVYHDRKGYEDEFRKHHTSSVTRDVWLYDTEANSYRQLTGFEGEDRNPVFVPGQNAIYYLSEEAGDFNIFRMSLEEGSRKKQLTSFEKHPVRYLTVSNNGTLCFHFDGEIYTMKEGQSPQKVNIKIATGDRYNDSQAVKVNSDISEMALSPNGKQMAFIHRG